MEFIRPEAEFTPPEQEYTPVGSGQEAPGQPKKRRLRRLAAAAAGLVLLTAGVIAAQKAPAPVQQIPTTSEELRLPPETLPEPDVQGVMVLFSSKAKGTLLFSQPERLLSVRVTVWETVLDMAAEEYEIPLGEIAGGEYHIPAFELWDIYMNNQEKYDETGSFPEPELRVTLHYDSNGEEAELQKSFSFREEQGWSVMYYGEELEPTEYVYPGYFVVRTYGSEKVTDILLGGDEALLPGQMRLTVDFDGYSPPAEDFRMELRQWENFRTEENGETVPAGLSYQTVVFLPRPDNLPQSGERVARFTVSQQLENYDCLWITEVEVRY